MRFDLRPAACALALVALSAFSTPALAHEPPLDAGRAEAEAAASALPAHVPPAQTSAPQPGVAPAAAHRHEDRPVWKEGRRDQGPDHVHWAMDPRAQDSWLADCRRRTSGTIEACQRYLDQYHAYYARTYGDAGPGYAYPEQGYADAPPGMMVRAGAQEPCTEVVTEEVPAPRAARRIPARPRDKRIRLK